MSRPLFSIITVTFNAAGTIASTLKSVAEQTCRLFEHIIVDGKSTDNTLELIDRLKSENAIVVSEPDRGLYDAMNKGMRLATGEYYIFLNAGDTFHTADTLELISETILENDFPGIVYGQTEIVDNERRHLGDRHLTAPGNLTLSSFKEGMTVCHQAFIAYYKITGPFNLDYRYSADYEWCIRCLQHSRRNVYIPATLIDYLYEGLTTSNRKESLKERFKIMCRYYGTLPTLFRHIAFIPRYLKRKKAEKRFTSPHC